VSAGGKAEAMSRLVTAYDRVGGYTVWVASELTPPARPVFGPWPAWVGAAAELAETAMRLAATRIEMSETDPVPTETLAPVVVLLDETAPWGRVSLVRDAMARVDVNLIMVNRDGTVSTGPSRFAPARDENETEEP